MKILFQKLTDRSGAAIALVALTMVVLLSCVALAVDVGMLVTARTEAQVVADGAALEGARALLANQGADPEEARDRAILAGSNDNTVRGENVTILPEDVDVIPEEWTVRVRVHRTQARGSAVPTFFAKIFGISEVDVSTVAAAWAVQSSTIGEEDSPTCPALPLTLYDKFEDTGEPGYSGEDIIGWSAADHGGVLRLKTQPSHNNANKRTAEDEPYEPPPVIDGVDLCNEDDASWRCWWRMDDEDPNVPNISAKIRGENCTDPVSDGDDIYNAAGNKQVNVHSDFQWVIDQDPDLRWCDDCAGLDENNDPVGCVVEGTGEGLPCFTGNSLRVRTVPIVDPTSINGTGAGLNAHVTGFMGVFIERAAVAFADPDDGEAGRQNVYLRLFFDSGTGSGTINEGEDDPEAFVRTLQLIE